MTTTKADESVASRAVAAALDAFNEPSMLQALQAVRLYDLAVRTTALMHVWCPPATIAARQLPHDTTARCGRNHAKLPPPPLLRRIERECTTTVITISQMWHLSRHQLQP